MANAIDGLTPALVWKYFAEISRIPRGSKNEKAIGAYLVATAKKLGLEAQQDERGQRGRAQSRRRRGASRCQRVPAGPHGHGLREEQGHGARFPQGPDRAGAARTTSSARTARRSAPTTASPSPPASRSWRTRRLEHGPLEFLFTVDEETGLTGRQQPAAGIPAEHDPPEPRFRGRGRAVRRLLGRPRHHRHLGGGVGRRAGRRQRAGSSR